MKKIVFCPITGQEPFVALFDAKQKEFFDGATYSEKIYYPVNVALANNLQKGDELKVVMIKLDDPGKRDAERLFADNSGRFLTELKTICDGKGAVISNLAEPVIITTEFKETKDVFEKRFTQFFEVLEENVEIYADITFGSRVFSMILMNILQFAEKFFNADVRCVAYGKTSFNSGKPEGGTVYDISYLHYLTNITNVLKADSGKDAVQAFKKFLED